MLPVKVHIPKTPVFLILLLIFFITVFRFISFVPVWDGWVFSQCYVNAAQTGNLYCEGHSSFIQMFLFSLTQLFSMGNIVPIRILTIVFTLIGLLSLRRILDHLFGDILPHVHKNILVFFYALHPIVLTSIIQPNLDFQISIYFLILLLFLLRKRFVLAIIVGLLMMFTKETGFIIYGLSTSLYLIVLILSRPSLKIIWKYAYSAVTLALPVLVYAGYMKLFPPFEKIPDLTWSNALRIFFQSPVLDRFFIAQLSSLYVINFAWILSFCILLGILFMYILSFKKTAPPKPIFLQRYEEIYCYFLIVLLTIALTRIKFYNNARYMLPVLPLFIILFSESISVLITKNKIRTIALLLSLAALHLSFYKTFDPVAKAIFGTFSFGNHRLLAMSSFTYPFFGYGRDELAYNSEFTYLSLLTEKVVQTYGMENIYVADENFSWKTLDFEDVLLFDPRTIKRTFDRSRGEKIKLLSFQQALVASPDKLFYIEYPNVPNKKTLQSLLKFYSIAGHTAFDLDGYSLNVLRLNKVQEPKQKKI